MEETGKLEAKKEASMPHHPARTHKGTQIEPELPKLPQEEMVMTGTSILPRGPHTITSPPDTGTDTGGPG